MTADSPIHGSAMLQMNTGKILSGSPCLGSWVNYGLGSVNENLPGFVVMLDPTGGPISGAKNWSSGYMPATYQGTILRSAATPILDLQPARGHERRGAAHACSTRCASTTREHLAAARRQHATSPPASPATSWPSRMQRHAPEAVDLTQETEDDQGAVRPRRASDTQDFGRQCLLARRLVERGVRFVQLYSGGAHNDDNWDAHGDLVKNHNYHAGRTDQADRRPAQGPEAARPARRDADRLGRRVRPAADGRVRQGHRPRPQRLRLHDVDGRRRRQGRRQSRRDRRTRQRGRRAPLPRQAPARHDPAPDGARSQPKLTYFYGGLDQKLTGVKEAELIQDVMA